MKIVNSPSPNQNDRPAGVKPRLIVVHGTAGRDAGDLAYLRDQARNAQGKTIDVSASYHYLIQRTGTIHRLVWPARRAWHAGKSSWENVDDVNDFSIGLGFSNLGNGEPFTEKQYDAGGWLCAVFRREYGIGLEAIVGHYHVSPGRKTDPWYTFEWGRLFARMAEH